MNTESKPSLKQLHFKQKHRPFIIPIFIPHAGCPHHCVFCNQKSITGTTISLPSKDAVTRQINSFLQYRQDLKRYTQIAFFGGNFLGLNAEAIKKYLNIATRFVCSGKIDSIRFSTRPDTIRNKNINIIKEFPVKTIEIGVQSMKDDVLSKSLRGHTASDNQRAVHLLAKSNYEIGIQLMIGLPGDNVNNTLHSGRMVIGLSPNFVRIYPTIVIENSQLAVWYQKGIYSPLALKTAITLTKKLYLMFREKKIRVIRMGLQASDNLDIGSSVVAGPYHPAFGHLVLSEIYLDKATNILKSYKKPIKSISIEVHPASIPKTRGLKNRNIKIMGEKFKIKEIRIIPNSNVPVDGLKINDQLYSV